MKIYVVTREEGEYEDIGFKQNFFNNKEDAYEYVYDFCLNAYETELARQTKKESKKRKGEWEASFPRENFEKAMAETKKKWDNYNTVTEIFDTDNYYNKAVFGHNYDSHSSDIIAMSIVEVK